MDAAHDSAERWRYCTVFVIAFFLIHRDAPLHFIAVFPALCVLWVQMVAVESANSVLTARVSVGADALSIKQGPKTKAAPTASTIISK